MVERLPTVPFFRRGLCLLLCLLILTPSLTGLRAQEETKDPPAEKTDEKGEGSSEDEEGEEDKGRGPVDSGRPWKADPLDVAALRDALEEARNRLEALTDKESPWRKPLERRTAELSELIDTVRRRMDLDRNFQAIPDEVARLEKELAQLKAAPPKEIPQAADQAQLDAAQAVARERRRTAEEIARDNQEQTGRLSSLPEALRQARKAVDEARRNLEAISTDAGTDPVLARYSRENAEIRLRLAEEKMALLEKERTAIESTALVRALKLSLAELRAKRAADYFSRFSRRLQEEAAERQRQAEIEAERARLAAERARDPLHRQAKRFESRYQALSASIESHRKALTAAGERLTKEEGRLAELKQEMVGLQHTLERRSGIDVGERLLLILERAAREQRRAQETLQTIRQRMKTIEDLQAQLYVELNSLTEERQRVRSDLEEETDPGRVQEVQNLLDEWYPRLRGQYDELSQVLDKRVMSNSRLQEVILEENEILDRMHRTVLTNVFWVQNEKPLTEVVQENFASDVAELGVALSSLPGQVGRFWEEMKKRGLAALLLALAALGLLPALLVLVGFRLRPHLTVEQKLESRLREEQSSALWQVVGRTLLALAHGVRWAVLLGVIGLLLQTLREYEHVSRFCYGLSVLWAVWAIPAAVFREKGVAHSLWKVPLETIRTIRRTALFLAIGGLLLVVRSLLLIEWLETPSISRLLYTGFSLYLLVVLGLVLRRSSPLASFLAGAEGGRGYRYWPFLQIGVLAVGVGIIGMDVSGYRFGAYWFAIASLKSLAAVLTVLAVYRILAVTSKRVASRRVLGIDDPEKAREEREKSLRTVRQIRSIAAVLAAGISLVLLAWFWDIDTRIFDFFDTFQLHAVDPTEGVFLTLGDLIRACLTIFFAWLLLKNLDGLFELFVFPRLREDAGLRYAVLSICRYTIMIAAGVIALGYVHLSGARIQWFVAAMGVGLGFGLQEIVSNFVSGILILLEQPIKVGDIVTVGDTRGTIRAIHIRATEIINLENQVIMVPNKQFIAERLINWTHNDENVRINVPVGVAYGTDLEKAQQVILDAVSRAQLVMSDPAPTVYFNGFADSSLTFDVRTYVPNPMLIPAGRHYVGMAVQKALRDAGITIPFPQRDLHFDPEVMERLGGRDGDGRAEQPPEPSERERRRSMSEEEKKREEEEARAQAEAAAAEPGAEVRREAEEKRKAEQEEAESERKPAETS